MVSAASETAVGNRTDREYTQEELESTSHYANGMRESVYDR